METDKLASNKHINKDKDFICAQGWGVLVTYQQNDRCICLSMREEKADFIIIVWREESDVSTREEFQVV